MVSNAQVECYFSTVLYSGRESTDTNRYSDTKRKPIYERLYMREAILQCLLPQSSWAGRTMPFALYVFRHIAIVGKVI